MLSTKQVTDHLKLNIGSSGKGQILYLIFNILQLLYNCIWVLFLVYDKKTVNFDIG